MVSENTHCKLLIHGNSPYQEEAMEFTTCYCPYPQCSHYGKRGFGVHLVCRGADRGIPRLLCTMCHGTFSARQGTAYFGIRVEESKQVPQSSRRNVLPEKRIDGALLMRAAHLPSAL